MNREQPFWKQILLDEYSPRCSALLVAVGMIIGLLPKENALAAFLLLLLVFIPGRLVYGILALVAFTFLSIPLDDFADRIGTLLHENTSFASFGSFLYTLPLGAWTRIDNTVVLGNFVLGSMLFVPVYTASVWMLKPSPPVPKIRKTKNPKPVVPAEPLVEPDDEIEISYSTPLESSGQFTGRFHRK